LLPSGVAVKVEAVIDEASADGMRSVGLRHFDVAGALESVGEIGALVVSTLGKARPSKTTVELRLGFAVESGKLTALWVGGKGEAALTVTLEWSGRPGGGPGSVAGSGGAGGAGEGGGRGAGDGSGSGPGEGSAADDADG
jgi:Trypsin-co-occurring domain 1